MAKVSVTKSLLDSRAQHINAKAGTTGAKTIAQMQAAVDGITTRGCGAPCACATRWERAGSRRRSIARSWDRNIKRREKS